jgi:hypothetical protein
MASEIQFVSNEQGEPTAVIVPIELWREIESERETAYLKVGDHEAPPSGGQSAAGRPVA